MVSEGTERFESIRIVSQQRIHGAVEFVAVSRIQNLEKGPGERLCFLGLGNPLECKYGRRRDDQSMAEVSEDLKEKTSDLIRDRNVRNEGERHANHNATDDQLPVRDERLHEVLPRQGHP